MASQAEEISNPVTGIRVAFRRTAKETGGELVEIDFFVQPSGTTGLAHVHTQQEERIKMVSGKLEFKVGPNRHTLGPGDTLAVPAGAPHKFWNASGEEAHFVSEIRPALNSEELLRTLFGLARDGRTNERGVPNLWQLAVIASQADNYLAAIPVPVQKGLFKVIAPVGKLMGYKASYPEYGS